MKYAMKHKKIRQKILALLLYQSLSGDEICDHLKNCRRAFVDNELGNLFAEGIISGLPYDGIVYRGRNEYYIPEDKKIYILLNEVE